LNEEDSDSESLNEEDSDSESLTEEESDWLTLFIFLYRVESCTPHFPHYFVFPFPLNLLLIPFYCFTLTLDLI
jgi:hypothetical protein